MIQRWGLVALLLTTALATGAPKAAPATQSADLLLVEASQAAATGKLADFATSIETGITPLLNDLNAVDLQRITRLAALREFGLFFSRIEEPDERSVQTLQWITQHPKLLETLMLAVGEADAPDRVLAVLSALESEHGPRLETFPHLAAAMCVVWDTPRLFDPENPQPDTERPVWLFRYLTQRHKQLRFDPAVVPWELSVYTVDNQVSQEEVAWALDRYSQRGAIGASYFDVPYDVAAFYGTADKAIGSQEYTLQNLVRFGGICADQAYFASNVARSIGVPACVVVGLGGASEASHAWVGFLDSRGKTIVWNFSEGRYPEHLYWKGSIQDPQTREMMSDSDVGLLAELARTNNRDRLASRALCKSADLAPVGQAPAVYMKAIDLSPGNRDAWLRLAALGADLKLSDHQFNAVTQVMARFAAKPYPDFAFDILLKLNSGRGTNQQLAALKHARTLFNRTDLLASIRMAEGDLMRANQQPSAALTAYGEVLTNYHNAGPIVLAALDRTEQLLREAGQLQRLAAIYGQTWQRLPLPKPTAYVRSTPYYVVARRYIDVLEEIGADAEAQRVRLRLNSLASGRAARGSR